MSDWSDGPGMEDLVDHDEGQVSAIRRAGRQPVLV